MNLKNIRNRFLNGEFVVGLVVILLLIGSQPGLAHAIFIIEPPTDLVATAGDTQATITFTASITAGVIGYEVTPSPASNSGMLVTGTGSPITVTGLTNGTSYTFTICAYTFSQKQCGPASLVSNAVTPATAVAATVGSILSGYNQHNPLPWETAVPTTIPGAGNVATSIAPPVTTPAGSIVSAKYMFNKNLELGMGGRDVKELQMFLNTHGFPLANFGPGSPGQETMYFGLLTKKALVAFQDAHRTAILSSLGLSIGTGYFGPSTRAFVNAAS